MALLDRYMIADGELLAWRMREELHLNQQIHTLNYQPRHTAAHVGVIMRKAQALFGENSRLSAQRIESEIVRLLERARITRRVSTKVSLKLFASGGYTIEYDEPSLYCGYSLRSLHPDAMLIPMELPMADFPTSAAAASQQLADIVARRHNHHTAILRSQSGELLSEFNTPLAIIQGTTIITPQSDSVESYLLEQAARKAGLPLEKRQLKADDLNSADEVLRISWQGVTAMAHVDGRAYMSILAERIAREFENLAQ